MHAGIVVLKDIVSLDVYNHFLLLYTAIRLLSCKAFYYEPGIFNYCTELLKFFVQEAILLYGKQFISFNVHNLIHLPSSVEHWKEFGPLYSNTAYPFENHLQLIKALVVSKANMLQQAVKQMAEVDQNLRERQSYDEPRILFSKQYYNGPTVGPVLGNHFKKLKIGAIRLTISRPDNCVFLNNSQVFFIQNFLETPDKLQYIIGNYFQTCENFFATPLGSNKINTVLVSNLDTELCALHISDVKWKACLLPATFPENGSYVVSPLAIEI